VNVARDLEITKFGDFRTVRVGEPDPKSGQPLKIARAIEVGHVFKLGTKYSEKFGAVYTDDQKQSHPMIMGCYGIGISRTRQAVVEQSNDADGIVWPWNVAPWQVLVVNLDPADAACTGLCLKLAQAAEAAGADVLIDDRASGRGEFKDADLIACAAPDRGRPRPQGGHLRIKVAHREGSAQSIDCRSRECGRPGRARGGGQSVIVAETKTKKTLRALPVPQPRLTDVWRVVVLNDPVNRMSYVVMVLRRVFGFAEERRASTCSRSTRRAARCCGPAPASRPRPMCSPCNSGT